MSAAGNLRGLLGDGGPFKSAKTLTVVGLATDPTQVIATDGTTQVPVSCLDGYRNRAAGDVIFVVQLAGGSWIAMGKIDADDTPVSGVMYGTGSPPGVGWRKAANTWVHANPDGSVALYTDMTSAAPQAAVISAADVGAWTGAAGNRGAASSSDLTFAAWYYGTAISAACSGKNPTAMRVRVSRDQTSGANQSLPVKLALHNSATWAQPTLTNQWDTGLSLSLGEYLDIDLPAAWITLLSAGTAARGIAAYGEQATQAMTYLPALDLTITFG